MVVHDRGHVKVNDHVVQACDGEVVPVLVVSPTELGLVTLA